MFSISDLNLDREELHTKLANHAAGAIVVFEGWVRNHNEGKQVSSLEYQVYKELALKEGERILDEAREKFNLHGVISVHREGHLKLGEIAIWIGATSSHRDDAFKACRYIIDEIKHRLPVWKKEHYLNEKPEWVFCRHHQHHVHFEEADYYQKQKNIVDQTLLNKARVLVVGAGGLGCPVLVNLAMAGVGNITVVDHDDISLSNIHRQFLYAPNLVGEKKAIVAKNRLKELNPFIQINSIVERFHPNHLKEIDFVVDCTDSMQAKYFIHDACLKARIPFISAGIYKSEGQIRTFIPGKGCLRCFVAKTPDDTLLGNCNDFGVLGVTTSVIGSLEASETIEFLLKGTNASFESTMYFNLKTLAPMQIRNSSQKDCPVCAGSIELQLDDVEVDAHYEGELFDIREMSDEEVLSLTSDKNLILGCHRGIRARKMAQLMRERGVTKVYSLRGGISKETVSCKAHGHHHQHQ